MRLEPSSPPVVGQTDSTGMPWLPRGPLVYARPSPAFANALAAAQQQSSRSNPVASAITVRAGQTLSGIVREQMTARGVQISPGETMRLVQTVARANNISDANLIHPGQVLDMDCLNATLNQPLINTTQVQLQSRGDRGGYPVLEKTIERAIEKGFIPAQDRQAVMNKIVQMSAQHRFSPDDFARLTLMESDGMNPKATNNRCHGIIQFCDGPDRGVASVGFASNPRAILGHSVLQQLDLVDKYFKDTGLKNFGPVGLDDLYLTVLIPAARNETRPNVALRIPGTQAAYLHVNHDTSAPITRNSILAGLHYNANARLRGNSAEVAQQQPVRASTQSMSAYAEPEIESDSALSQGGNPSGV